MPLREKGKCTLSTPTEKSFTLIGYSITPCTPSPGADLNGGPTIPEARKKTSLTLMAGIDHVKFPNVSAGIIRNQIKSAMAQAGNTKFILAPGCSLPTFSYPPLIKAACAAVRGNDRFSASRLHPNPDRGVGGGKGKALALKAIRGYRGFVGQNARKRAEERGFRLRDGKPCQETICLRRAHEAAFHF